MKGKVMFVAGAAVGYVLGARAGRKRYEQISAAAAKVWETPGIQRQVQGVQDYAARKVGDLPGALVDGAKRTATALFARVGEAGESVADAGERASDAVRETAEEAPAAAPKPAATRKTPARTGGGSSAAKKASTTAKKPAAKKTSTQGGGTTATKASSAKASASRDGE